MPTLPVLINEILAIKDGKSAVAAMMNRGVTKYMFSDNFGDDTTNCYLISEYVAKALVGTGYNFFKETQSGAFAEPLLDDSDVESELRASKGGGDVWFLKAQHKGNHNLVVARHGRLWALLHGWDGEWSIFPKLNNGRAYIFWGHDMGGVITGLLKSDPGCKVHKASVDWPSRWAVKKLA
jgi:hypothetical protein